MSGANMNVPDDSDWDGYESDIEVAYLHNLFYGKSIEEVKGYFGYGKSIERMSELEYAPRPVFQYYVHAFARFLRSEEAVGDSDSASAFLSLLDSRERLDPGCVRSIFHLLDDCVTFVAKHQYQFNAPVDIYGKFKERAQRIRELCGEQ
jgi:hypothetical protein